MEGFIVSTYIQLQPYELPGNPPCKAALDHSVGFWKLSIGNSVQASDGVSSGHV